jgi:L-ribulose-5-phosphate 4-epimerase
MECQEAKDLVVKAGVELVQSGLIARTWGNVSCRIDEDTFVITPSGRDYLSLRADDIVEVKIKDLTYTGETKPSSEKGIHAEVYRQFPKINFVIHTHQETASALSATGLDFIPLPKDGSLFSRESFSEGVLCAKYALPGTKALRRNVAEALKKTRSNAVILKHHGAVCFGIDYKTTFEAAHDLEKICSDFIAGKTRLVAPEQNNYHSPTMALLEDLEYGVLEKKGGYVVLNTDPDVIRYSHMAKALEPFLDDFAQIVGRKVGVTENRKDSVLKALRHASAVFVKGEGALCWGRDANDAAAVSMILRKNCKACFVAALFGKARPIPAPECVLMRFVYLNKYSRLSEK